MFSLFQAVRRTHAPSVFGSLLRISTRVHMQMSPTVKTEFAFQTLVRYPAVSLNLWILSLWLWFDGSFSATKALIYYCCDVNEKLYSLSEVKSVDLTPVCRIRIVQWRLLHRWISCLEADTVALSMSPLYVQQLGTDVNNFISFLKEKQDTQCTYNVTLRRVRVTIIAVEKQ
jgi:hypothetical protein